MTRWSSLIRTAPNRSTRRGSSRRMRRQYPDGPIPKGTFVQRERPVAARMRHYRAVTTDCDRSGRLGDRTVHPGHHAAQLLAGLLDRVRRRLLTPLGEVRPAGVVLGDPLAGELAALD